MELVEGGTLVQARHQQANEVFEPDAIKTWVEQLCQALEYAHTKTKIVHRDLKPANLMLDADGDLKIADFSIAASVTASVSRVSQQASSSSTPLYMSPQLMMGKKPSITDDIYALGATLYELLVGNPPFFTGNVMMQVLNKPAPDLNEQRQWVASENGKTVGDVSAVWVNTIMACLAKEAEDRPQSAREVWDRLTGTVTAPAAAQPAEEPKPRATVVGRATRSPFPTDDSSSHSPKKKSSVGLVIGGVALVAVLGAAGWWFGVEQPKREAAAAELVRIEEARIAAEELAAQAELVRIEQEQAEADRLERERLAAEAAEAARLAAARGGVIVTTDPAGAEVMVGGFARERTPATLKDVKLGTYPVVVTLAGYEEQRLEVTVKENAFANLSVPLVRSTGGLSVASNPPGLEVAVSGDDYRTRTVQTPVKLDGLPTGEYTLTYSRADWPEQTQRVSVERNATASALAEFIGGGLEITTSPSGAEVWSAGKQLGTTPLSFVDLKPGDFDLELRLKGYESAQRRGKVVSKETVSVAVTLEEIR